MQVNFDVSVTQANCLEEVLFKKDVESGRKISITSLSEGNQS